MLHRKLTESRVDLRWHTYVQSLLARISVHARIRATQLVDFRAGFYGCGTVGLRDSASNDG